MMVNLQTAISISLPAAYRFLNIDIIDYIKCVNMLAFNGD
jgi:hypothetical protein